MHSPHPHCSEVDTQQVATLAVLPSGLCKPGKGIPTPTVPHAAAAQDLDHPTAPFLSFQVSSLRPSSSTKDNNTFCYSCFQVCPPPTHSMWLKSITLLSCWNPFNGILSTRNIKSSEVPLPGFAKSTPNQLRPHILHVSPKHNSARRCPHIWYVPVPFILWSVPAFKSGLLAMLAVTWWHHAHLNGSCYSHPGLGLHVPSLLPHWLFRIPTMVIE